MTKNLKRCPFCGSEAFLADDDEKNYGVFIACSKCCSSTEIFKTEDEALIAWNTRPIEDEFAEKIKKLESENKRLREALEKAKHYLKKVDRYILPIADEADYFAKVRIDEILKGGAE